MCMCVSMLMYNKYKNRLKFKEEWHIYIFSNHLPIKHLLITEVKKKSNLQRRSRLTPSESSVQSNTAVVMVGYNRNHDRMIGHNERNPVSLL